MNKKIPLWIVLLLLWFSLIITLTFGWAVWHFDKPENKHFHSKTGKIVTLIASFPNLVKYSIKGLNPASPLNKPDLYPSINGFKFEKNYVDSNYILLSTYDKYKNQPIVKLIRLYDRKLIYQWAPDIDKIKDFMGKKYDIPNDHKTDNLAMLHSLISSDGSVIFHSYLSSLIKIDKNSKLEWVIKGVFDHSLEHDADGNTWVESIVGPSNYLNIYLDDSEDDEIMKISQSGKVLFKKSVTEILVDNGYRGILFGVGPYEGDLLHLNDIQPALTSTKYWMKDDLLISLRNKSTVFLYRPSENKVLWLKTGPWLNQHDVDYIDNERIGIFGNNTLRNAGSEEIIDGHNEEYVYNFKTNKTETPYTEFLSKAKVSTRIEGRSDILPNGDLFIEETGKSRLLRGNSKDIIWQYVNRIDKQSVAALTWCRFITKEEFKKLTFLQNKKD
jgi:hypothetical protein